VASGLRITAGLDKMRHENSSYLYIIAWRTSPIRRSLAVIVERHDNHQLTIVKWEMKSQSLVQK